MMSEASVIFVSHSSQVQFLMKPLCTWLPRLNLTSIPHFQSQYWVKSWVDNIYTHFIVQRSFSHTKMTKVAYRLN
jgi:hypothetical protein